MVFGHIAPLSSRWLCIICLCANSVIGSAHEKKSRWLVIVSAIHLARNLRTPRVYCRTWCARASCKYLVMKRMKFGQTGIPLGWDAFFAFVCTTFHWQTEINGASNDENGINDLLGYFSKLIVCFLVLRACSLCTLHSCLSMSCQQHIY